MDIITDKKSIGEYLKLDSKIKNFVIPEYQRAYSWTIDDCEKLWQDINEFIDNSTIDGVIEDKNERVYFFGTIIGECDSSESCFKIVDGQQRTTTFLLLCKALLLRLTASLGKFPKTEASGRLKRELENSRDTIIEILYKVRDRDIDALLEDWNSVKKASILKNCSNNEQYSEDFYTILKSKSFEEISNNVIAFKKKKKEENRYTKFYLNFKYFYEVLAKINQDTQLDIFARTYLEKCQLIEIRSSDTEQAIAMFNSLNSTGQPLTDADIISADLYAKYKESDKKFDTLWKKLIETTNELEKENVISIDSVLQQYMYIHRAENNNTDTSTPGVRKYYKTLQKQLLDTPIELAGNFRKIADIWNKIYSDFSITKLILKFNSNIKLFLMSYLYRYDAESIDENLVIRISECLLRLFAALEIGESSYSTKYFKIFLFKENVNLVDKDCPIEKIEKDFHEHIKTSWKKEDLKEQFDEYDRNALVFLNEYLYTKEKNKDFVLDDSVNIEHIMPDSGRNIDTIRQDAGIDNEEDFHILVNKLGNKILLEEKINKSLGNDWFKTKISQDSKKSYSKSKYIIAKDIAVSGKSAWTKEDIDDATEKAIDRILKFIFA